MGFGYYSAAKFGIEGITHVLREEVAALGIQVLAVAPGAFRTRAYAGFADEPVTESIEDYQPMLESVREFMVARDGARPGDPYAAVRAVIAAIDEEKPPRQLVLGSAGYDAVVERIEGMLADIRAREDVSRGVDFPDAPVN